VETVLCVFLGYNITPRANQFRFTFAGKKRTTIIKDHFKKRGNYRPVVYFSKQNKKNVILYYKFEDNILILIFKSPFRGGGGFIV